MITRFGFSITHYVVCGFPLRRRSKDLIGQRLSTFEVRLVLQLICVPFDEHLKTTSTLPYYCIHTYIYRFPSNKTRGVKNVSYSVNNRCFTIHQRPLVVAPSHTDTRNKIIRDELHLAHANLKRTPMCVLSINCYRPTQLLLNENTAYQHTRR